MKNNRKKIRLTALHFCFLFALLFVVIYIKGTAELKVASSGYISLDEIEEWEEHLIADDQLSFILFHDGESNPVRLMEHHISRLLAEESVGACYKVHGLANEDLCIQYQIAGFPSVLVFRSGEEVGRIQGVSSYYNLKHIYKKIKH
ncbi:MAG: thioredoxin family protein [Tannerellaceae bacterium]|nr:thioredoxin family protein [Tannerellaceae bacterium]